MNQYPPKVTSSSYRSVSTHPSVPVNHCVLDTGLHPCPNLVHLVGTGQRHCHGQAMIVHLPNRTIQAPTTSIVQKPLLPVNASRRMRSLCTQHALNGANFLSKVDGHARGWTYLRLVHVLLAHAGGVQHCLRGALRLGLRDAR